MRAQSRVFFSMDPIKQALLTLCDASDGDLKVLSVDVDHELLRKTIQNLQKIAKTTPPKNLAQSLNEKLGEIKEFLIQSPEDSVGKPPEQGIDGRLADIQMLEGTRTLTLQDHLRRFLAERSFALQFSQCYPQKFEHMKKARTFDIPRTRDSMRLFASNISKTESQKGRVRAAVTTGLKYLLIEQEYGISITCILGFFRRHVDRIKFSDVCNVVVSEKLMELDVDLNERTEKIVELYDLQRTHYIQASKEPPQKRPRTTTYRKLEFLKTCLYLTTSSDASEGVPFVQEPDAICIDIRDVTANVQSYMNGKEFLSYEATTIENIRKALGQHITDTIKSISSQLNEHTILTCVRTSIPKYSFLDAIVSIDIGPAQVLAEILFPASASCIGDGQSHLLHHASVVACGTIFPQNILEAIKESQLRRWEESLQLLNVTNCVTMDVQPQQPYLGTIHLRIGFRSTFPILQTLYVC